MQRFRVLILFVLPLLLGCVSCTSWQEAKDVIAMADSIDQTEHVIWNDTAAFGQVIRQLDNPIGRLCMSSTLGKAYYYMRRNHSLSNRIAEAADCYIEADRLHIDDPIYRGRVNSCMGYICGQNNSDSLALIFIERAGKDFQESGNKWRYAQNLLERSEYNVYLHNYNVSDSLLQIAQTYQLDSNYWARYFETIGIYFYEQQQYDSALVYFNKGLNYWQTEEDKCFSYLRIMQSYRKTNCIDSAVYYAHQLICYSDNPNHISNAYYWLIYDAKTKNDIDKLSQYTYARADALKSLLSNTNRYAEAVPQLEEYSQNPHPWRWVWITIACVVLICLLSIVGIWIYRQRAHMAHQQIDVLSTQIFQQEEQLLQDQCKREFENKLAIIRDRYHTPHKRWRKYVMLKRDIEPWLHEWNQKLDALPLSENEKVFCTITLIYSHFTDVEIADYMCYGKKSIRTIKNRMSKKLGISSAELPDFLRNLSKYK